METKKIVMGIISVAVAIIVLMSMIPIFTDAGASEDTFTNEGLPYIKATSDDSYTLVWDPATPDKATVNGSEYTIWKSGDGNKNISIVMIPDKGIIRYNMQYQGIFNSNQVVGLGTLDATTNGFTLTYENGTYTITNGTQTITGTSDSIYAIGNGNFVLKNPTDRSYLLDDSEIFGMGVTNVLAWNNGFQIEGDNFQIDGDIDNVEVSAFSVGGGATMTISNVADDLAEVSDYKDLFTLNKVTFTATGTPLSGDPVTVDATYSYFLVPAEVTAERSAHASPVEATLIGLIPLLMMVGIMLTAVGLFIAKYRKN